MTVDSELLDMMITWDQTGTYEVAELQAQLTGGGSDDWMTTLLQTRAFHRIPPANIQAIFLRMQRMNCRAGEIIIQQGAEGDYFYAIVSGKCLVTRETPLNRSGLKLAELGIGDTFGEEALISEAKRNATVTMLTDGVLMRLNKKDFRELMNEPLVQWVDFAQARELIARGGLLARRAAAVRIPERRDRGRTERAALLHTLEDLHARPLTAVRGVLRHRAAQLRCRLHSGRARIRRLCAQRRSRQRRRRPASQSLTHALPSAIGAAAGARRAKRCCIPAARPTACQGCQWLYPRGFDRPAKTCCAGRSLIFPLTTPGAMMTAGSLGFITGAAVRRAFMVAAQ